MDYESQNPEKFPEKCFYYSFFLLFLDLRGMFEMSEMSLEILHLYLLPGFFLFSIFGLCHGPFTSLDFHRVPHWNQGIPQCRDHHSEVMCPVRMIRKHAYMSNTKKTGCLGYVGDEILPSYFIKHEIRIPIK